MPKNAAPKNAAPKNAPTTPTEWDPHSPIMVGGSSHRGEYATIASYPTPSTVSLTDVARVRKGRGFTVRAQIGETGLFLALNAESRANILAAGVREYADISANGGLWAIGPSRDGKALVVLGRPKA